MSSTGERRRSDRLRTALWRLELGEPVDPTELIAAAQQLAHFVNGAARQTVERDFSASLQAQRYEALYEEILRAQQLPAQLARC